MKRLTCEMCGSTDLIKQDGVFVCQSCGCKYSVEEARKLMIEGKVDVSGSTVKIDKSNEIDNLLIIARRARDEGNYGRAASNYDDILKIQPNNWEANFYRSYCSAFEGRIIDIPSNLKVAVNTAISTVKMLLNKEPFNESACAEIVGKMGALSVFAFQNYYELYSKNPEWVERNYNGVSKDEFTHNKGNYMQLQENLDGVITTMGALWGQIGGLDKMPSSICQLIIDMIDAEEKALEAIPQNPFANASWQYRDFYNVLANRTALLFKKIGEIKKLMEQMKDAQAKIEVLRKREEEEKQKAEDRKQLAKYWNEHPAEKVQLESQKKDLLNQIQTIDGSIKPIKSNIKELERKKAAKTPSEKESLSLNAQYNILIDKKNQLGLFQRKEKVALQTEIDAIVSQINMIERKAKEERDGQEKQIDREIKPLQDKLKPLLDQKESLIKKHNDIAYKLTHELSEAIDPVAFRNDESSDSDTAEDEGNFLIETGEKESVISLSISQACLSEKERLHIQTLKSRKQPGKTQEDLFLEDMQREKNLRQLIKLWEIYDFDKLYPSVDTILRQYREKEKESIGGLPLDTVSQIKQELSNLFGKQIIKEPIEEVVLSRDDETVHYGETLYCEKCRILTSGPKCMRCGNKKIRRPASSDICFLAEKRQVAATILEEELKQANIPYTARSRQGAGITMTLGNVLETYRFYVQYKDLTKAKEIDESTVQEDK